MNNKIIPVEVRSTTLEEEVVEVVEDMKEEEDIEVEEEVEEQLADDKDRLSIIIMDNRVTSHKTADDYLSLLQSSQSCY